MPQGVHRGAPPLGQRGAGKAPTYLGQRGAKRGFQGK